MTTWVEWALEENLTFKQGCLCAAGSVFYFGSLAIYGYLTDKEVIEVFVDNGKEVRPGPIDERCRSLDNGDPYRKKMKILKRRKMAWSISLGNSFICSVIGVIYLFLKYPTVSYGGILIPSWPMVWEEHLVQGNVKDAVRASIFYGKENFGYLACIFFGVANVMDIALGSIFYSRHFSILTTYFHHTIFTWLMVFAITTHGGFVNTPTPFVPSFVIALIEEIPTFLLALGTVFPVFRSDLAFGVTFFWLRIVFHLFYLSYCLSWSVYQPIIWMFVLSTVLHVMWFKDWITGQGAKYLPTSLRVLVERKSYGNKDNQD